MLSILTSISRLVPVLQRSTFAIHAHRWHHLRQVRWSWLTGLLHLGVIRVIGLLAVVPFLSLLLLLLFFHFLEKSLLFVVRKFLFLFRQFFIVPVGRIGTSVALQFKSVYPVGIRGDYVRLFTQTGFQIGKQVLLRVRQSDPVEGVLQGPEHLRQEPDQRSVLETEDGALFQNTFFTRQRGMYNDVVFKRRLQDANGRDDGLFRNLIVLRQVWNGFLQYLVFGYYGARRRGILVFVFVFVPVLVLVYILIPGLLLIRRILTA